MSMEFMGNLGSMIGSLAIFVSLLYLAVETRVNTKAIRSAAYHSAAVSISDNTVAIFGNKDINALFLRACSQAGAVKFSDEEQMQFSALASQILIRYEDIFAQYRQGAVSSELWEVRRRYARSLLELPTWKATWEVAKNSSIFIPAFIEEIDTAELVPNASIGLGGPNQAPSA